MALDLPALHRQGLAWSQSVIEGIDPSMGSNPTPCAEWNVEALVHHIVYGNYWVAPLVAGETIEEVGDRFEGDILAPGYGPAHAASAESARAAFDAEGAMDAPCAVSYGPVPGCIYCGHRTVDLAVHGWDLATAVHGTAQIPEDLVDGVIEVILPQFEMLAGSGLFGDGRDPGTDVDPHTRLLTMMGRSRQ